MKRIEELKKILHDQKDALKDEYGVSEIGFFGSYVEGKRKESSDIDILVEFQQAIDLFSFVHLKNHLSELLGANVDLVMKKALKPRIGERILSSVIYV
jgi:predicted nucleotidyltransferase